MRYPYHSVNTEIAFFFEPITGIPYVCGNMVDFYNQ